MVVEQLMVALLPNLRLIDCYVNLSRSYRIVYYYNLYVPGSLELPHKLSGFTSA